MKTSTKFTLDLILLLALTAAYTHWLDPKFAVEPVTQLAVIFFLFGNRLLDLIESKP